jgi:hypothetical protein
LIVLAISAPSISARADDPVPATHSAESQVLFADAKALVAAKKYSEACPKFEASLKLEPGLGTRFDLADCYEHVGRLASAWAMFGDVRDLTTVKSERDAAQKRVTALEPRLIRVTIDVPENVRKIPGLTVQRGDMTLSLGQFGTAVPVDPGQIDISARAPSKKPWKTVLAATEEGATLTVRVPMLEDAPLETAPSGATTAAPAPSSRWTPQRIGGAAAAGLGIVAVGLGATFGAIAIGKKSASEQGGHCDKAAVCDTAGLALRSEGRGMGDASTAWAIG